jgi:hypothetical protein
VGILETTRQVVDDTAQHLRICLGERNTS